MSISENEDVIYLNGKRYVFDPTYTTLMSGQVWIDPEHNTPYFVGSLSPESKYLFSLYTGNRYSDTPNKTYDLVLAHANFKDYLGTQVMK